MKIEELLDRRRFPDGEMHRLQAPQPWDSDTNTWHVGRTGFTVGGLVTAANTRGGVSLVMMGIGCQLSLHLWWEGAPFYHTEHERPQVLTTAQPRLIKNS